MLLDIGTACGIQAKDVLPAFTNEVIIAKGKKLYETVVIWAELEDILVTLNTSMAPEVIGWSSSSGDWLWLFENDGQEIIITCVQWMKTELSFY